MKDPVITSKVKQLKDLITQVNEQMAELEDLCVDVRITYIESSKSKNIKQGLSIWRIEEHNNYLYDE